MKMKRFVALLLCFAMLLTYAPMGVFAEEEETPEYVAYIGEQGYETLEAAITAAKNGETISLVAASYTENDLSALSKLNNKGVIVQGQGMDQNELKVVYGQNASDINGVNFKDLTLTINHSGYNMPYTQTICGNYERVKINGLIACDHGTSTFKNCVFTGSTTGDEYILWQYGGTMIVENCNFLKSASKAVIKLYCESNNEAYNEVTDCVFDEVTGSKGCAIYASNSNNLDKPIYEMQLSNNTIPDGVAEYKASGNGLSVVNPTKDEDGKYTGGTFITANTNDEQVKSIISNACAESYTVTTNEDGTYSLGGGSNDTQDPAILGYRVNGGEYETLPDAPVIDGDTMTVTTANAQYALDGAYGSVTGKTIVFTAGTYDRLIFGRPTKYAGSDTEYRHGSFANDAMTYTDYIAYKSQAGWTEYAYYARTISNVTFRAESGAILTGMTFETGAHISGTAAAPIYDYVRDTGVKCYDTNNGYFLKDTIKNITFEGITFVGAKALDISTSQAATIVDGIHIIGCTFTGTGTTSGVGPAIRFYTENQTTGELGNVKNLTVTGTTIDNYYQGIYSSGASGIAVTENTIKNTGHNAVAVQTKSGAYVNIGVVSISNNNFTNVNDRVVRFGSLGTGTSVTIDQNTAVQSGDDDGELIKDAGILAGVTYQINGNTYTDGEQEAGAWTGKQVKLNTVPANGVILRDAQGNEVTLAADAEVSINVTGVVPSYVAQIGEVTYESLNDALNAINDLPGTDAVTLKILKNVTEEIENKKFIFTRDVTITADSPVVVNVGASNGTKVSKSGAALAAGDGATLTIGENVTIDNLYNFGVYRNNGTAIINGTVKAYYFRAMGKADLSGYGNLVINGLAVKPDSVDAVYYRFENKGVITINGNVAVGTNPETADVKLANICVNAGNPLVDGKLIVNNSNTHFLKATDGISENFSVELHNSYVTFGKADFPGINVTEAFSMDATSTLNIGSNGTLWIKEGATAYIVPGAKIYAKGLNNEGTIEVDLEGANPGGDLLIIDFTGNPSSADAVVYGTVIDKNSQGELHTVVKDYDLYATFEKSAVSMNGSSYATVEEALKLVQAGTEYTITLLQDNAESFTLPANVTFDKGEYAFTGTISAPTGYLVANYFTTPNIYRVVPDTIVVTNTAEAQAALDTAIDGMTIVLAEGDYGVLEIRQTPECSVSLGQDGGYAVYTRSLRNVTVKAADGASVNVAQIRTKSGNLAASNGETNLFDGINNIRSILRVEDMTIDGLNFNDASKTGVAFYGGRQGTESLIYVNGLKVQNCSATGDNTPKVYFVSLGGDMKGTDLIADTKDVIGGYYNIQILNNTVNGRYQPFCMSNAVYLENLTISGNTVKNCDDNAIQVSANPTSGTITITDNTFTYHNGRIARIANAAADAVFVLNNNTITTPIGYDTGKDGSAFKITGTAGFAVTEDGNNWLPGEWSADYSTWISMGDPTLLPVAKVNNTYYGSLKEAIAAAQASETVTLLQDIDETDRAVTFSVWVDKDITIDLNNHEINGKWGYGYFYIRGATVTIANGKITNELNHSGYQCNAIMVEYNSDVTLKNMELNSQKYGVTAYSDLTITDNSSISSVGQNGIGVLAFSGASVVMDSGSIRAENGYGAYLSGRSESDAVSFTVSGGTVYGNDRAFQVVANDTYTDGKVGSEDTRPAYQAIVNVNGGEITGSDYGVALWGKGATVNMTDGCISGGYYAITGNGSHDVGGDDNSGTVINISGGSLEGGAEAIYHPQYGVLTISGGTLTGESTGIEMRAGELNVSGGTIVANAVPTSTQANSSGTSIIGAAVGISQHTTKLPIIVNITGGEMEAYTPFYQENIQKNPEEAIEKIEVSISGGTFTNTNDGTVAVFVENVSGFISGGKFDTPVPIDYCADTKIPDKSFEADENGYYTVKEGQYVCHIVPDGYESDDLYFTTLKEALDVVHADSWHDYTDYGSTIILDRTDIKFPATYTIEKNVTIITGNNIISPEIGFTNLTVKNGTLTMKYTQNENDDGSENSNYQTGTLKGNILVNGAKAKLVMERMELQAGTGTPIQVKNGAAIELSGVLVAGDNKTVSAIVLDTTGDAAFVSVNISGSNLDHAIYAKKVGTLEIDMSTFITRGNAVEVTEADKVFVDRGATGTQEASGGHITSSNGYALNIVSADTVKIGGGWFKTKADTSPLNASEVYNGSISGGFFSEFKGTDDAPYVPSAYIAEGYVQNKTPVSQDEGTSTFYTVKENVYTIGTLSVVEGETEITSATLTTEETQIKYSDESIAFTLALGEGFDANLYKSAQIIIGGVAVDSDISLEDGSFTVGLTNVLSSSDFTDDNGTIAITLRLTKKNSYEIQLGAITGGTVTVNGEAAQSSYTVLEGESITLQATPAEDYRFDGWFNENNENYYWANPCTVTPEEGMTIVPKFVQCFSVSVDDLENGTVVVDGFTVTGGYNALIDAGGQRTLKAVPAAGYKFDHWEKKGRTGAYTAIEGGAQITISPDASVTYKPVFVLETYSVTVSSDKADVTVNVTPDSGTIDSQFTVSYSTTNSDYVFTGWFYGDKLVSNEETYTFTLNDVTGSAYEDVTLTAKFVGADYAATFGEARFETLKEAIETAHLAADTDKVVTLNKDITDETDLKLYPDVKIALNGKTISSTVTPSEPMKYELDNSEDGVVKLKTIVYTVRIDTSKLNEFGVKLNDQTVDTEYVEFTGSYGQQIYCYLNFDTSSVTTSPQYTSMLGWFIGGNSFTVATHFLGYFGQGQFTGKTVVVEPRFEHKTMPASYNGKYYKNVSDAIAAANTVYSQDENKAIQTVRLMDNTYASNYIYLLPGVAVDTQGYSVYAITYHSQYGKQYKQLRNGTVHSLVEKTYTITAQELAYVEYGTDVDQPSMQQMVDGVTFAIVDPHENNVYRYSDTIYFTATFADGVDYSDFDTVSIRNNNTLENLHTLEGFQTATFPIAVKDLVKGLKENEGNILRLAVGAETVKYTLRLTGIPTVEGAAVISVNDQQITPKADGTCDVRIAKNEPVKLRVVSVGKDYKSTGWKSENGTVLTSDYVYTFTFTGDTEIRCGVVAKPLYSVHILVPDDFGRVICFNGSETVTYTAAAEVLMLEGTQIRLEAVPVEGRDFTHWSGEGTSVLSKNPVAYFLINGDSTFTPCSDVAKYKLNVTMRGLVEDTANVTLLYHEYGIYGIEETVSVSNMDTYRQKFLGWFVGDTQVGTAEETIFTFVPGKEHFTDKTINLAAVFEDTTTVAQVVAGSDVSESDVYYASLQEAADAAAGLEGDFKPFILVKNCAQDVKLPTGVTFYTYGFEYTGTVTARDPNYVAIKEENVDKYGKKNTVFNVVPVAATVQQKGSSTVKGFATLEDAVAYANTLSGSKNYPINITMKASFGDNAVYDEHVLPALNGFIRINRNGYHLATAKVTVQDANTFYVKDNGAVVESAERHVVASFKAVGSTSTTTYRSLNDALANGSGTITFIGKAPGDTGDDGETYNVPENAQITFTGSDNDRYLVSGTVNVGAGASLSIQSGRYNAAFVGAEGANIVISGGAFKTAPDAAWLAEGYGYSLRSDDYYVVGKYVAVIGEGESAKHYTNIEDAIKDAHEAQGDTVVTLLESFDSTPITLQTGVILDLNGKTAKYVNSVDSARYVVQKDTQNDTCKLVDKLYCIEVATAPKFVSPKSALNTEVQGVSVAVSPADTSAVKFDDEITITVTFSEAYNADDFISMGVYMGKGIIKNGEIDRNSEEPFVITISAKDLKITNSAELFVGAVKNLTKTLTIGEFEHGTVTMNGQQIRPDDLTIAEDQVVTLVATPEPGYRFVGWVNENGKSFSTFSSVVFTATGDKTVTPVFELASYNLVIDATDAPEGVTFTKSQETISLGESVTVTLEGIYDEEIYKFKGWFNANMLTSDPLSAGKTYTFTLTAENAPTGSDFELEARFKDESQIYNIVAGESLDENFSANNSTKITINKSAGKKYRAGEEAVVKLETYNEKVFRFDGWYDQDGNRLSEELMYTFTVSESAASDNNIYVYAHFARLHDEWTFTVHSGEEGGHVEYKTTSTGSHYTVANEKDYDVTVFGGDTIILMAVPDDGYVFAYWADMNGAKLKNSAYLEVSIDKKVDYIPVFMSKTGDEFTVQYVYYHNSDSLTPQVFERVTLEDLVEKQSVPNSYLGKEFIGWRIYIDGEATEVQVLCEEGTNVIDQEKLKQAIQLVAGVGSEAGKTFKMEAIYKESEAKYWYNINYMVDGKEQPVKTVQTDSFDIRIGESIKLTAPKTFTDKNGQKYSFNYWMIDGVKYYTEAVSLCPNTEGKHDADIYFTNGDIDTREPVVSITGAYRETEDGINKIAVTLSINVPENLTVKDFGFVYSTRVTDPKRDNGAASTSFKPDGWNGHTATGTIHLRVQNKEANTVYVRAYLEVEGIDTIYYTDKYEYVWYDLSERMGVN